MNERQHRLYVGEKLSEGDTERVEGGAEAASEVPASAKWVLGHQQPPSTPDDSPLSARDRLDLDLIARQGRTLGEKPWDRADS